MPNDRRSFIFGGTLSDLVSFTSSKRNPIYSLGILFLFFRTLGLSFAQAPSPVAVPTWRYDLTHAGQNPGETALTPANVNVNSFGRIFSVAVDGSVFAQPLYVPGLTMGDGKVHNVLFVATEHDSVYAFDADSNTGSNANPLWQASMLSTAHGAASGATTVPDGAAGSPDIQPEIGITGTPAINPASNTMYLVAATKENGGYVTRLHALNILTGAERVSPVAVTATVPGTGHGSSGGELTFSPLWENQRTALDYYKGYVYFGFSAHGDLGPWHGWLFAYNADTLEQSAVVCTSPSGFGSGIWGAGAGLPIDEDAPGGRMFLPTGNGTFSAKNPPLSNGAGLGEGIVQFNLSNGGLTLADSFTSFNAQTLNSHDLDLGSGGLLMVPDQQGAHPHILVQTGKEGRILVADRDNLGGYAAGASSNTNILQDISGQMTGLWSTPAYWNGNVYFWGSKSTPMLFHLNNGILDTKPASVSSIDSTYRGASFSVSSNGTHDGVAWAIQYEQFNTGGPAILYAWDANDLSTPIYESDSNAKRDSAGRANKYAVPVVTNGKVYVATQKEIDVYGLLSPQSVTAKPVFNPPGGTYNSSQNVKITSSTAQNTIYYTLDGTTPTTDSTPYTGQIPISADTTIEAIATTPNDLPSPVATAQYTIANQTPPVTFSPAGGTYPGPIQVQLADTDSNAAIYYTTDGTQPNNTSSQYTTSPIAVANSLTINAIAIDPSLTASNVTTAAYVIGSGGQSISFGSGFSSAAGLSLNGSATQSGNRMELTTGAQKQAGSFFATTPAGIQSFTTDFQFQLSNGKGDGITFAIQNAGPSALGTNTGGLGYAKINKSIAIKFDTSNQAGEGTDSTGLYTDGAKPTVPALDLTSSGIVLRSGDLMSVHATYDGTTLTMTLLDEVTNDTFTFSNAIDIPSLVGANTAYVGFTGSTGGLTSTQSILTWTYTGQ